MPRRKAENPVETEEVAKRTRSSRKSKDSTKTEARKSLTFEEASQEISGNKLKQKTKEELQEICKVLGIDVPETKGDAVNALTRYYDKAARERIEKEKNDAFQQFITKHPLVPNRETKENPRMDLTLLKVDPVRPYIYGLSQGENMSNDAYLFIFNKNDGKLIQRINVGANATGMDVSGENLYVANCGILHNGAPYTASKEYFEYLSNNGIIYGIRKVKLDYFSTSETLFKGDDFFHITCIPGGAITEGRDQWVAFHFLNLSTGETDKCDFRSLRSGRCVASPEGFYYHIDHNNSGSTITKYNASVENNTSLETVCATERFNSAFPEFVMSGNGERFFAWPSAGLDREHDWYSQDSFVYDKNLEKIATLQHEILAANHTGDVLVTQTSILTLNSKFEVEKESSLPFQTRTMCVCDNKVWLYNKETDEIQAVPIGK